MFLLGRAQQLAPLSCIIKSIVFSFFSGEGVAISHPSLCPVLLQCLLNPWASGDRQGKRERAFERSLAAVTVPSKKVKAH